LSEFELSEGSIWHRWEPHIHAPGTLFNDQFKGSDPWAEYLSALENATPQIRALGITDYYLTDYYELIRQEKEANGRLPNIDLIFPNVELRLDIATTKGGWVNAHLLVSPEDPEHLVQLKRLLGRLRFPAHKDAFACTPEDLTRLGYTAKKELKEDPAAALRYGATQFKVNFQELRQEFLKMGWATENILIALSGGKDDGTSGVREAADTTLRQEMESFARIIFASSAAQRDFWLGLKGASEDELRERYGGLKPCLHGCDAHDQETVAKPAKDRFSWIKGGVEFDALRQACIDPATRANVGDTPPQASNMSQRISHVEITDAAWLSTPRIPLNPGLVAIIGARGSGKTALADVIAMGCDAIPDMRREEGGRPSSSFLRRAAAHLGQSAVTIGWHGGDENTRFLDGSNADEFGSRARYLSQQFVEDLCTSTGMTDALVAEIERVIFEAHPIDERDGSFDFESLRELKSLRYRQLRDREAQSILTLSERIGNELEKHRKISELKAQVKTKSRQIQGYMKDRLQLATKGSQDRVKRLSDLTEAADEVRNRLAEFSQQEQTLLALQDEVVDLRKNQAPELLREAQERHLASRMSEKEWGAFLLDYKGNVDIQLVKLLAQVRAAAKSCKGAKPKAPSSPSQPYVSDDAKLTELPLAVLAAEIDRLQALVSADTQTARRFGALTNRITEETVALRSLKENLKDAEGAEERVRGFLDERDITYAGVFRAIAAEQKILVELYRPLMERLSAASGTLKRLSFAVSRSADVEAWSKVAEEELVDLRRQGPFKGKGNFYNLAAEILKQPWETGTPEEVSAAMDTFRERYQNDLLAHSTVPKGNHADYRAWSKRFAQWLFSTDHISLQYGIFYDGVDITNLSPGTRGIVLLLLYLALDVSDDRPLIIDQPEENLDPKSVFDELIGLFNAARMQRQVIIVTHNANLVVNTDADQIIIAEASPRERGQLPTITYASGGLESEAIRKLVCDILEGGEHAFKERARRLRVRLGQ
jgi:putative AbiEii toxin of type IV toxin-antitoxin system